MVAGSRESGAAGRLVSRAEARRRWPSLLGLAILIAVVVTAILAVAGGARRTATVVDRYLNETAARDCSVFSFGLYRSGREDALPPATDALRQLEAAVREVDGVDEVGGSVGFPTGASAEFDFTIFSSPEDTMFSTIDRPVVREGRLPAAGAANEVALNEVSAELLGVGVGDVIEAPTFALADCEALLGGTEFPGFNGPLLRLEVVGRVLLPDDLRGVAAESGGPIGVGSPAFAGRYDEEVCSTVSTTRFVLATTIRASPPSRRPLMGCGPTRPPASGGHRPPPCLRGWIGTAEGAREVGAGRRVARVDRRGGGGHVLGLPRRDHGAARALRLDVELHA